MIILRPHNQFRKGTLLSYFYYRINCVALPQTHLKDSNEIFWSLIRSINQMPFGVKTCFVFWSLSLESSADRGGFLSLRTDNFRKVEYVKCLPTEEKNR